jgi:hydroxymethylbilane synthase
VTGTRPIRIGTRGSALARVQAGLVASALRTAGAASELVVIETEGDRRAPDTAWGEGAFVAAIERALLDGRVDVAVHSAKDVPTEEDPRLAIAAFLPRADPLDALVLPRGSAATGLADLPSGSVVGTDSPRRSAFLRACRPDLVVRPLHGNVDTRLRRLDSGEADALVLAVAGLDRLGRADRISERLPADVVPPAPGQGAIAVQVRAGDRETRRAVALLDDAATRTAVMAERALLRATGGGCRAPIGALATVEGSTIRLLAGVGRSDGTITLETIAVETAALAEAVDGIARRLATAAPGRRVLVTRPLDQASALAIALRAHGIEPVVAPTIAIELAAAGGPFDDALRQLPGVDWAVVTSPNGARAVAQAAGRLGIDLRATRWAAVGGATAAALFAAGIPDPWLPPRARGAAIASALPARAGARVLLLRGSLADDGLPRDLRRRGFEVEEAVAYRTVEAPATLRAGFHAALVGPPLDAVLFASESAVRGALAFGSPGHRDRLLAIPAMCVGPATAAAAAALGFRVLGNPATPSAEALAASTARLLGPLQPGAVS